MNIFFLLFLILLSLIMCDLTKALNTSCFFLLFSSSFYDYYNPIKLKLFKN